MTTHDLAEIISKNRFYCTIKLTFCRLLTTMLHTWISWCDIIDFLKLSFTLIGFREPYSKQIFALTCKSQYVFHEKFKLILKFFEQKIKLGPFLFWKLLFHSWALLGVFLKIYKEINFHTNAIKGVNEDNTSVHKT